MIQNYTFTLTNSEKMHLKKALSSITYQPDGNDNYISSLRSIYSSLPKRIVEVLDIQRKGLEPYPFLIFKNLPVDDEIFHIPNPNIYSPEAKSGSISENLIMLFASIIGEPYSIAFEGKNIVNNLIPIEAHKKSFTGLGSEVELDFHIENAALKFLDPFNNISPSALLLTGVNYVENSPLTKVSYIKDALVDLNDEEIKILQSNSFKLKYPYRWRISKEWVETDAVPILSENLNYPEINIAFYPDMVKALTPESNEVLKKLHQLVIKNSYGR